MRRKFLILACVLALLVGTLSIPAAATEGTMAADDFKAGFASVDMNPYWSTYSGERKPATMTDTDMMPLPMAGYGDNAHRLSAPELFDDNGDGKISGPDGDGLHATVLAIQSGDKTVLMITVDVISVKASLTKKIRTAITEATGISGDYITVAGTHTHGGVDMTVNFTTGGEPFKSADGATSYTAAECNAYLDHYEAYMISQLAAGSAAAVADLTPATMEKGTVDMLAYNDGKIMNNVRHYNQSYTKYTGWFSKTTVNYVRGSSFNNDVDGNGSYDSFYNYGQDNYWSSAGFNSKYGEATPVSDSDHSLHVLKFNFENGKEPIAVVNWRGHPANSNRKANGQDVYNILNADYIGSMRYALDSRGFRTTFILGASGNLGINTSVPSKTWLGTAASAAKVPTIVFYGRILADASYDLLSGTDTNSSIITAMHEIESGPIMTSRMQYRYKLNVPSELEANAAAAAKAAYAAGTADPAYSYVYTDPTTKEVYVVASSYHANSAVNRAEYTAGQKATMELNVITVGEELAFLALPYEASDRYSAEATLATANNYNDWDLLAAVRNFGTPFVITCANDHRGYVPNSLAYTYNTGSEHAGKYAAGSYESQTTYAAQGEGEKLITTLKVMMEQMESKTGQCQYCNKPVVWEPLTAAVLTANSNAAPAGHYYLHDDLTYTEQVTLSNGNQLCLDLNGHTYSVNAPKNASRAFAISGNARLNIQDSSENETGRIMGHGVLVETATGGFVGGTIRISSGEINLYSGTLTQDTAEQFHATSGGVISMVGGVFNMYGGAITGGKAALTSSGGNVCLDVTNSDSGTVGSTFNMYDGVISNGTAGGKGGNIYVASASSFNMYGGTVSGGTAANGNSIFAYGNVALGGNAQVNAVKFNSAYTTRLRIDGVYTGSVTVTMPAPEGGFVTGTDVGNALNDANIDNATITFTDCDIPVKVLGSELILVAPGAPATMDQDGNLTYYKDLAAAMTAYEKTGSTAVKLIFNKTVSSLTINDPTRDVYIDINGYDLNALIATGENKVYISDSATDDFTVADGVYGCVPADVNAYPAPGYLKVTEGKNISFHKYEEVLTTVNLRPGNVGIYYGSRFAGDEKVKDLVSEYGVALQVLSAPTAQSIAADTLNKMHAGTSSINWKVGAAGNTGYGVLLKNIMKPDNSDSFNKRNAKYPIYGVAYMRLTDGTILVGQERMFTLQQVVESVDDQWSKLNDTQKNAIITMYQKYVDVMGGWDIPNMKEYVTE